MLSADTDYDLSLALTPSGTQKVTEAWIATFQAARFPNPTLETCVQCLSKVLLRLFAGPCANMDLIAQLSGPILSLALCSQVMKAFEAEYHSLRQMVDHLDQCRMAMIVSREIRTVDCYKQERHADSLRSIEAEYTFELDRLGRICSITDTHTETHTMLNAAHMQLRNKNASDGFVRY